MTIKDWQDKVNNWILETGNGYFDIKTNMCILMEEVGELASVVARTDGDQIPKVDDKINFEEELTDILWIILCLANQKDVDLAKTLHDNLVKKSKRDANRYKINK